jgi:hypothetical protein
VFKNGELVGIHSYLDFFPFQHYIILRYIIHHRFQYSALKGQFQKMDIFESVLSVYVVKCA